MASGGRHKDPRDQHGRNSMTQLRHAHVNPAAIQKDGMGEQRTGMGSKLEILFYQVAKDKCV